MWREVAVWMCMREEDGVGSLQHRARFLCEFTLSGEDDDSSIVLLHGCLSDLLSRLWCLRRRFAAERLVCVCQTDVGARRQEATEPLWVYSNPRCSSG